MWTGRASPSLPPLSTRISAFTLLVSICFSSYCRGAFRPVSLSAAPRVGLLPPSLRSATASSIPAFTPVRSRHRGSAATGVSPTGVSRLQEKEELRELNDSLAFCINKVRSLEKGSGSLQRHDPQSGKLVQVKAVYETELTRSQEPGDTARQRAKLQIELCELRGEQDLPLGSLRMLDLPLKRAASSVKEELNESFVRI